MKIKPYLHLTSLLLLLAACGGGTIEATEFPAMSKTEGDAPFVLKAPTSISPAPFAYGSSDPEVATVSGSTVTVLLAGTTTISASQATYGSYGSSSTSAVLTVKPITCTAPLVRLNGKCASPPPACTLPATLQDNACVPPSFGNGKLVAFNNASWTPTAFISPWATANAYCSTTTINGQPGWRLPTEFELKELHGYRAAEGQGWVLGATWSSTTTSVSGSVDPRPVAVSLVDGSTTVDTGGQGAYITCVR